MLTLSAISAIAGLVLTLQSAPVHRREGPTIKWPGPAFLFKQASKSVISTLGFECLICSLVTNRRTAPEMLSSQGLKCDRQLKDGVKRMDWQSYSSSWWWKCAWLCCWTIRIAPVLNKKLSDPWHRNMLGRQDSPALWCWECCVTWVPLPSEEGQSPAALHWVQPRPAHAPTLAAASAPQPHAYAVHRQGGKGREPGWGL